MILAWAGFVHPTHRQKRDAWGIRLLCCFLLVAPGLLQAQQAEPTTVRILVLSLFHPQTLELSAAVAVTVQLDGRTFVTRHLILTANGDFVVIDQTESSASSSRIVTVPAGVFTLHVHGAHTDLTRRYTGALTVSARGGVLQPVVTMPTETAVASIVAAEAAPGTPAEALKAQAIAARSFLLAHAATHPVFLQPAADACDTTHCQFLRSSPALSSPVAIATRATTHQVLLWRASADSAARIVPAMYARSCGGHTRANPAARAGDYPFYAVRCEVCLAHPERWRRAAIETPPITEAERLRFNRVHGWAAIPSENFEVQDGALAGRGTGHGLGLCQRGAAGLAARGESAQQILSTFFPNTTLGTLP